MEGRLHGGAPESEAVSEFLSDLGESVPQQFEALGLGQDLRFHSTTVAGAALEIEGELLHLMAFSRHNHDGTGRAEDNTPAPGYRSRVIPFSRRRRGH